VKDVSSSGCSVFAQEPPDMDGGHVGETVCYLAAEAGSHSLAEGGWMQAGTVETSSVHKGGNGFGGERVGLSGFTDTPAVLHSLNSYNNGAFLSSVASSVSKDGFDVQQEAAETGVQTTSEVIGWVAFQPGAYNGYEASSVRDGSSDGAENSPHRIAFKNQYSSTPDILVKGNSGNGEF